jgi:hypothetical protein
MRCTQFSDHRSAVFPVLTILVEVLNRMQLCQYWSDSADINAVAADGRCRHIAQR